MFLLLLLRFRLVLNRCHAASAGGKLQAPSRGPETRFSCAPTSERKLSFWAEGGLWRARAAALRELLRQQRKGPSHTEKIRQTLGDQAREFSLRVGRQSGIGLRNQTVGSSAETTRKYRVSTAGVRASHSTIS